MKVEEDEEVGSHFNNKIWDTVLDLTKSAQENKNNPLFWAIQVSSKLNSFGVSLPCIDLANLLVSHICWENNVPIAWKFLEKALILKIVPPFLVLGLLSTRVIPYRRSCPAAFRLYMELLKRHAFLLKECTNLPNYQKTMNSLHTVLRLSQIFGIKSNEADSQLVLFIFSISWQLVDVVLDDEGIQLRVSNCRWPVKPQDMEIDIYEIYGDKKREYRELLQTMNISMALELIGQFLQNKVTFKIRYLARQNMLDPISFYVF